MLNLGSLSWALARMRFFLGLTSVIDSHVNITVNIENGFEALRI